MTEKPILIAGGGPVGVVAALALARQGFAVRVFEADASINEAPRAATIHPATLEMLAEHGECPRKLSYISLSIDKDWLRAVQFLSSASSAPRH